MIIQFFVPDFGLLSLLLRFKLYSASAYWPYHRSLYVYRFSELIVCWLWYVRWSDYMLDVPGQNATSAKRSVVYVQVQWEAGAIPVKCKTVQRDRL